VRTVERERVEVRSRLAVVERRERVEREAAPRPHQITPPRRAPLPPLLHIGTIDVHVAAPPAPTPPQPAPVPQPAAAAPAAPAERLSRPAPIFGLAQG
jgi:hypothetical protein